MAEWRNWLERRTRYIYRLSDMLMVRDVSSNPTVVDDKHLGKNDKKCLSSVKNIFLTVILTWRHKELKSNSIVDMQKS